MALPAQKFIVPKQTSEDSEAANKWWLRHNIVEVVLSEPQHNQTDSLQMEYKNE